MNLEERMARAGAHIAVAYTFIGASSVGLLVFGIAGMWGVFAGTCVVWLISLVLAVLAHNIQRDTLALERIDGRFEELAAGQAWLRDILTATDSDGAA